MHTEFISSTPFELRLSVEKGNSHLVTEQLKGRLTAAITARLGDKVKIKYELRDAAQETLAARDEQRRDEAMRRARQAIESDPNVRDLASVFGAEVVPESIKPVAPERRESRPARHQGNRDGQRGAGTMKGDIGQLMKQAQRMQAEMQKAQAELASLEVQGEAGGGLVRLVMTCAQQVKSLTIDPSLVSGDREMLEDVVVAAFNDALRKVERTVQERYSGLTAGLGLPGGMRLPF